MGLWIPDLLLEWREPRALRAHRSRKSLDALPACFWLFWAVVPMVIVLAATIEGSLQAACEFGIVALYCFLHPRITAWLPNQLRITDRGIRSSIRQYSWSEIERCRLDVESLDRKDYLALILMLKNGKNVTQGVGETVSSRQVESVILGQGIPVDWTPAARSL